MIEEVWLYMFAKYSQNPTTNVDIVILIAMEKTLKNSK